MPVKKLINKLRKTKTGRFLGLDRRIGQDRRTGLADRRTSSFVAQEKRRIVEVNGTKQELKTRHYKDLGYQNKRQITKNKLSEKIRYGFPEAVGKIKTKSNEKKIKSYAAVNHVQIKTDRRKTAVKKERRKK